MNIEPSTLNVLLGVMIALQAWLVRKLFSLDTKLAIVLSHCPYCRGNMPKGGGVLRKALALFFLLLLLFSIGLVMAADVPLRWDWPANTTNPPPDYFALFHHSDLTVPVQQWPLLKSLKGYTVIPALAANADLTLDLPISNQWYGVFYDLETTRYTTNLLLVITNTTVAVDSLAQRHFFVLRATNVLEGYSPFSNVAGNKGSPPQSGLWITHPE